MTSRPFCVILSVLHSTSVTSVPPWFNSSLRSFFSLRTSLERPKSALQGHFPMIQERIELPSLRLNLKGFGSGRGEVDKNMVQFKSRGEKHNHECIFNGSPI